MVLLRYAHQRYLDSGLYQAGLASEPIAVAPAPAQVPITDPVEAPPAPAPPAPAPAPPRDERQDPAEA
jgi:hypothetical protein